MSKDEASKDAFGSTDLVLRDAEERAFWRAVLLVRLQQPCGIVDAIWSADAAIRAHRARIS